MANRNTNQNVNQNVNVNVDAGRGRQGGSSTRTCGACRGSGYADGPVQMVRCRVCGGKGFVRV